MDKKIALCLIFLVLCTYSVAAVDSKTINYSSSSNINTDNAQFSVVLLKYEPFPVNPGSWFDVWVKIENVGRADATNLKSELESDSSFNVENPIRTFSRIPGTSSAYGYKQQLGDNELEVNQVLLKFHVQAAANSAEETKDLKLSITADGLAGSRTYDLPIDIAKTKTDFSVNLNTISPEGAVFDLSNIGDNLAKALVVDVKGKNVIFLEKYSPESIGDLKSGAVATASLRVLPVENSDSITLNITYTDFANERTSIEKTVYISKESIQASKTDFDIIFSKLSPQESSFSISNLGSFLAKSVTVSAKDDDGVELLENYAPVSIGDMASGDIALVHLRLLPKDSAKELTLQISYTDSADSRRTTEKQVKISKDTLDALCPPAKDISYMLWIYGAAGFLCGAFLIVLSFLILGHRRKKRSE